MPRDRSEQSSVSLRRASPDDAELVHQWRSEPATRRFQPIQDRSLEEVRELLAVRSALFLGPAVDGELQWLIEADGTPVGWVTLRITYRAHGVAELGYTIAPQYHRRGYMTAAIDLVLPLAFDPVRGTDLWRVEASAAVGNLASRRVLEGAGFLLEGVARASAIINGERIDHARYALLRPDWQAAPRRGYR
jgi:RimJ/RimL family protein N-acetyltransferase